MEVYEAMISNFVVFVANKDDPQIISNVHKIYKYTATQSVMLALTMNKLSMLGDDLATQP